MRAINRVIVHHSASSLNTTASEIREWHMAKGWRDIGYHYVIERDGSLVRGRQVGDIGTHARGANRDSVGICVVGNNTKVGSRWLPVQRYALNDLMEALHLVLGSHLTIHGHRDVGSTRTECPGVDVGVWN